MCRRPRWLAPSIAPLVLTACQGTVIVVDSKVETGCPEEQRIGDGCAGLLPEHSCRTDGWTEGVSCSRIEPVDSDAALAAALARAEPGDCIDLLAGRYQAVTIPAGVGLLGRGYDCVELAGVTLTADGGATLRGATIEPGGIVVDGAGEGRLHSVRIRNSAADGIEVRSAASVAIGQSEIASSARYGLSMFTSGQLQLRGTLVQGNAGPGLWLQCSSEHTAACDCATALAADLEHVRIRDNKLIGLSVVGAQLDLRHLEVSGNTVDDHFQPGAGLSASECSHLSGTGLRVTDNTNFGVLMEDSSAELGAARPDEGIEIARNLRGLVARSFGTPSDLQVRLQHGVFAGNTGAGLVFQGASGSFECQDCTIRDTELVALPVVVDGVSAGAQEVGDGLQWCDRASVRLDGLVVDHSARASVLIDGPVGPDSRLSQVTLSGGDELIGIVQQNLPAGAPQPEMGPDTPPLTISGGLMWPSLCERPSPPP